MFVTRALFNEERADPVAAIEAADLFARAVDAISSPRWRAVFLWRHVWGYSRAEIADHLGISRERVGQILKKADREIWRSRAIREQGWT